MDEDERQQKKSKIIKLIGEGMNAADSPEHLNRSGSKRTKGSGAIIAGRDVVAGRDININKREVKRTIIKPGPEHITPEQAAKLQELVRKAVDRDVAGGMTQRGAFTKWWSVVKRRYNVPSYLLIPRKSGDEAISWLRQQVAINRTKYRRNDPPKWRNELYRAIWTRANELGMSKGDVYGIVLDRLGKQVPSLTKLGDNNLKKMYNIIMAMGR